MMNKLYSYLIIKYAKAFSVITIAIIFIISIAESLENLKKEGGFLLVLALSILRVPSLLQETAPFIILFSALYLMTSLINSNEFYIIKASGISIWKMITPLVGFIFIIGVFFSVVVSPLSSTAENKRTELFNKNVKKNFSYSNGNVWILDHIKTKDMIIKSDDLTYNKKRAFFKKVTIFQIENNRLTKRIDAANAILTNHNLDLFDVTIKDNINFFPKTADKLSIKSSLSVKNLFNIIISPKMIILWKLPAFIKNLAKLGLNTNEFKIYFYQLLIYPLSLIGMFLIGISFAISPTKRTSNISLIAKGVVVGFIIYFMMNLISSFGNSGILPPIFSIIGEILLINSFGLLAIIRKESL